MEETQEPVDAFSGVDPAYRQSFGENIKSVNDLARSYSELTQNAKHSIRIPTESSSDEALLGFDNKMNEIGYIHSSDTESIYNKLGRPTSAEDYTVPEDGTAEFQNYYKDFRAKAHEIGITNKQMEAMIAYDKQQLAKAQQDAGLAMEGTTNVLKKMYGNDLENRAKGVNIVIERLAQLDNTSAEQLTELAKLNPLVFKLLADAYETGAETHARTPVGNVRYNMTPDEAKVELEDMLANPRSGIFEGNKQAMERFDKILMKKHGLA